MIGLLTLVLAQSWQACAPMPTPGYGFACAAVGPRVYAIGGAAALADTFVPRLAVEAYDAAADSWISGLAPLPGPRKFAGCAELDGRIYVIGGYDGNSDFSRVDRYDPLTNTWDTVAPLPWPRWALAGCAYAGRIYAIGGFSTALGYQRAVARFTPDSGAGRWDVVDSLVTPRTSPAAAVAGGTMCAVGGKYYNDLSSFESYQSGDWVKDSRRMSWPRSGAAAIAWGSWLCAIGGQNGQWPLNSVEIIDVEGGGNWLDAAYMSTARTFFGASLANGYVVVIGGWGTQGVIASVEKADSTLFAGIEESPAEMQLQCARSWATVASGHVRITCRNVAIYDGSGRRVFAGSGPVDVRLAPGVYFARVTDADGQLVSGRITVVR